MQKQIRVSMCKIQHFMFLLFYVLKYIIENRLEILCLIKLLIRCGYYTSLNLGAKIRNCNFYVSAFLLVRCFQAGFFVGVFFEGCGFCTCIFAYVFQQPVLIWGMLLPIADNVYTHGQFFIRRDFCNFPAAHVRAFMFDEPVLQLGFAILPRIWIIILPRLLACK